MNDLSSSPPPDDDTPPALPAENAQGQDSARHRPRRPPQILTPEQCLAGISQLPFMLLTKYISPAQGNAMLGAYGDLVRYQQADRHGPSGPLPAETILELVRQDPRLLNLIEQCLTDEQFEWLSAQIREGDSEQQDG